MITRAGIGSVAQGNTLLRVMSRTMAQPARTLGVKHGGMSPDSSAYVGSTPASPIKRTVSEFAVKVRSFFLTSSESPSPQKAATHSAVPGCGSDCFWCNNTRTYNGLRCPYCNGADK